MSKRQTLRKRHLEQMILDPDTPNLIAIVYYGSGDSGAIEGTNIRDYGYEHPVIDLIYELTDSFIRGYENNEGGQGTIYWNVETDVITIEHEENIMTQEDHKYTIGPEKEEK